MPKNAGFCYNIHQKVKAQEKVKLQLFVPQIFTHNLKCLKVQIQPPEKI